MCFERTFPPGDRGSTALTPPWASLFLHASKFAGTFLWTKPRRLSKELEDAGRQKVPPGKSVIQATVAEVDFLALGGKSVGEY